MSRDTQVFLACRDCGEIHSVTDRLPRDRWLLCRRYGRRLWRSPLGTLGRPLAYAAAAIILFGLVNTFALFEIGFVGDHRSGMIISGAIQLTRYSTAIAVVGVFVALMSIIIPALTLVLIFAVLARLVSASRGKERARLGLADGWRMALRLRPWSMLDLYLLGAVVAYTRLRRLADVVIGVGGYVLAALVFVQVLIEQSLGRQRVWHAIGDPVQYGPKPGKP
jgi:paraquat-inducible protein A